MRAALLLARADGDTIRQASGPRLWGRRVLHLLAIAAGWMLFFWGWHRVLARGADFSELRLLMLGAAIVVPVITVSWILHNRGIHRRKGPRRSVRLMSLEYHTDFNGRAIEGDFAALALARRVDIVVDGACKRYLQGIDGEQGVVAADAGTAAAAGPVVNAGARSTASTS